MVALPELTKEGYRILTYRLQIYNLSHITFGNGVKVSVDELINKNTYFNCFFFYFKTYTKQAFNMFNDMVLSRDGPINGYVVVFDMQGVCLRHLTLVQFGPLRNFMSYIQVRIFSGDSRHCENVIFQLFYLILMTTYLLGSSSCTS